ncbi:hypothetical protein [Jannaschia sp. CCS1]|uniref:hypothetical protein n=1 Tax=Jannaschia sp. (strain CCS1) TaxID=290400 RepID=UPI00140FB0D4|nr:hypothetical protein [Jannaschia sp. CCS1]
MAKPPDPATPRNTRLGRWIWVTITVIAVVQVAPSLFIVFQRGIAGSFDWIGYIIFQLGTLIVPLAIGCLGLLFRRNRGLGFFIVSVLAFVFSSLGSLTQ